jgi:PTH1 family peptidyl-tRNA hydrolase
MKLIIGLGNIGEQYDLTRHNVGFMALDRLVVRGELNPFRENKKLHAKETGLVEVVTDDRVMILKPTTMMNLSGRTVASAMKFYGVAANDVWIIYDDLDLPFGSLRIKRNSTPGTHNGLRSIYDSISANPLCFRIGISNLDYERDIRRRDQPLGQKLTTIPAAAFVLQKFNPDERNKLPKILDAVCDEILGRLGGEPLSDEHATYSVLD